MTDNIGNAPAASSQRLEYIDIAKGIGIFLVVIGHSVDRGTLLGMYIGSFHMPLFFLISGLCFNDARYPEFVPFFKRRVRTLLLPVLYFCVLIMALSAITMTGSYTFEDLCEGHFSPAMWFVFVLFLTELLYWFISQAFRQKAVRMVVLLVCLAVGVALDRFDASLPFSMCTVFAATFFYGMGNMCRGEASARLTRIPVWGGILLVIPLISVYFTHKGIGMSRNSIPSPAIWICLVALIGTAGVLVVSSALTKAGRRVKNIILYIGKNTLAIVGLHMFFIALSSHYIAPLISSKLAYKGVEQIFIWLMLVICIQIINARLPWLVGKSRAKA